MGNRVIMPAMGVLAREVRESLEKRVRRIPAVVVAYLLCDESLNQYFEVGILVDHFDPDTRQDLERLQGDLHALDPNTFFAFGSFELNGRDPRSFVPAGADLVRIGPAHAEFFEPTRRWEDTPSLDLTREELIQVIDLRSKYWLRMPAEEFLKTYGARLHTLPPQMGELRGLASILLAGPTSAAPAR